MSSRLAPPARQSWAIRSVSRGLTPMFRNIPGAQCQQSRPVSGQIGSHITRRPQQSVQASYYRGGTSRAIFFKQQDLPSDKSHWDRIFLGAIGSPDPDHGRQLDGMGGGISSLSKACVVGPPSIEGADVDYTFAALGVRDSQVDYSSNCGNMSAAVGPFAVDSGMVAVPEETLAALSSIDPQTKHVKLTVRIHNTNTGKLINATFPLALSEDGSGSLAVEAASSGPCTIDGVAGSAAPVRLDFVRPAGSRTGKLLPTGRAVDMIELPPEINPRYDGRPLTVHATLIDAGNPCVFVPASDLGVSDGTLSSAAIDEDAALKARLEAVRRRAAVMMGLADSLDSVPGSVPKIGFVSRLASRPEAPIQEAAVVVRAMSVGQPHKAIPVTVALAAAAAARLSGTVVADSMVEPEERKQDDDDDAGIVIHHASGTLAVGAKFDDDGHLGHATVYRTARRLMEGRIFWK